MLELLGAVEQQTTSIDYTPTAMTVVATLLAAAFTSVISQYFFAPWLEVRKQIKIAQAQERAQVADEARDHARALAKLQMVRTGWQGSQKLERHWETAMNEYRERISPIGSAFAGVHTPMTRPVRNLMIATGWVLQIVYFRRTPEKAPVAEAMNIAIQLSKAVDPVVFPLKRAYHARRGIYLYKKLMKSIKDLSFGD